MLNLVAAIGKQERSWIVRGGPLAKEIHVRRFLLCPNFYQRRSLAIQQIRVEFLSACKGGIKMPCGEEKKTEVKIS